MQHVRSRIDFQEISERGLTNMKVDEAELLYESAREIEAKNMLEIGSMFGCSSMVLGSVARDTGGHLQCIEAEPQELWTKNIQDLGLSPHVTMIEGRSPWIDMRQITLPIDYLFIDAEHRTRWCLTDYQYWSAYVRPGGRIAFHDYCRIGRAGKGVMRAVDIIMEDELDNLSLVGRVDLNISGLIVYEKGYGDSWMWPFLEQDNGL